MYSLFPGFNADPINGDDMDGSGTNWPVWPNVFDSYEPCQPMIITSAETEVFSGCADYVVPCARWSIVIPWQNGELHIRRAA